MLLLPFWRKQARFVVRITYGEQTLCRARCGLIRTRMILLCIPFHVLVDLIIDYRVAVAWKVVPVRHPTMRGYVSGIHEQQRERNPLLN